MVKNYYEIFGLPKEATATEIKHAYYKLSQKFHPDKNEGDPYFTSMFRQINEAYQVLSNPKKRQNYDRKLFEESQKVFKRTIDVQEVNRKATNEVSENFRPSSSDNDWGHQSTRLHPIERRLNTVVGIKYCLWALIVLMVFLLSNKAKYHNTKPSEQPVRQSIRHKHRHIKKSDRANPQIQGIPDTIVRTDTPKRNKMENADSSVSIKDSVKRS